MQWLKIFDEAIKKTMAVKYQLPIFEHHHEISPHFASITKKEEKTKSILIKNGYLLEESTNKNNAIRTQVHIGDKTRGYGSSYASEEGIPNNPQGLLPIILKKMDDGIKVALTSYIGAINQSIYAKGNYFFKLSAEKPIQQYDKINEEGFLPLNKNHSKAFESITKRLKDLPHVTQASAELESIITNYWFSNSEGTRIRTQETLGRASISIFLKNKEGFTPFLFFDALYDPQTHWNNALALENIITKKLTQEINAMQQGKRIPAGFYPIIFDGHLFGTFMHEAIIAHTLSGRYIANKESNTYEGKIGQQVMPNFLTIEDNPTLLGGYGSFRFDDEGVEAKNSLLVEKGVLKNYLLDRTSAYELQMKNNGRSRSEWLTFDSDDGNQTIIPEPRVSNIVISAENAVPEKELIRIMQQYCSEKNIPFGLYASGLQGEVNIENGIFSLTPNKMIAITPQGKKSVMLGGTLHGSPFLSLNNIYRCSDNIKITNGVCGSNSGFVHTQERAPSAFFPSIEVSSYQPSIRTDRLL
jgi:predicted Zn-dependent protease